MMLRGGLIDNPRPSRRRRRRFLTMRLFFYAIKDIPHAEERPKGASRSTRDADAVRFDGGIARLLVVLLITLALAGCGKKGGLQPPPDEPNVYPRSYPSE
jgi:hypothetical protein